MANQSKAKKPKPKKPKPSVKYAPRPITAPGPAVVIARSLPSSPASSPASPSIVVVDCASTVSAAFSALQKCNVIAVALQTAKREYAKKPFGTIFSDVPERLVLVGVTLANPPAREELLPYSTTTAPPPSRPRAIFVFDLGAILPDFGGILSDGVGPLLTSPDVVLVGSYVRKNLRLLARAHRNSVPCLLGHVCGVRQHKNVRQHRNGVRQHKKKKSSPLDLGLVPRGSFIASVRETHADLCPEIIHEFYAAVLALCSYACCGPKLVAEGGPFERGSSSQRFEVSNMWVWKCRTCDFHILQWDDVYSCPRGCPRKSADPALTSDPFIFMVRVCIPVDGDEARFVEKDAVRRSTLQKRAAQKKVAEKKKKAESKKETHREGGEALDLNLVLKNGNGREKMRAKRFKKTSVLKTTKSLREESERDRAYRKKIEASRVSSKHHSKKAAENYETARAQHRKNCIESSKKDPKLKSKRKSAKRKSRRKAMAMDSTAAQNMKIHKLSIRDVNDIVE